jgi:hypothetical protein
MTRKKKIFKEGSRLIVKLGCSLNRGFRNDLRYACLSQTRSARTELPSQILRV